MFGLGKKKKELSNDTKLYSPIEGEIVELSTVSDPIFAKKVMGDGFAVEPTAGATSGKIFSPVAGEVTVFQGHAVGLKRADGLEVLLHVGIDTVSLNGAPFSLKVAVGDILAGGEEIGSVDWSQIDAAGLPKSTMVLITNTATHLDDLKITYGQSAVGAEIGQATAK